MTRAEFKARVARKIGLTLDGGDEETFLNNTFPDAIVEVLLETHCYVELGDMTLTANQAEYRMDSNILALEDARETSSGQGYASYPQVVSLQEILSLQTLSQSGSPVQKIAMQGSLLVVWPTPSLADVIRFVYVPRPTATSSDTHDSSNTTYGGIPTEYDRALEYYGLWQASEYDEKKLAEGPKDYAQQFHDECQKVKERMRRRQGRRLRPARIGYPGTQLRSPSRNDVYPQR
jgi:hypothetical protein